MLVVLMNKVGVNCEFLLKIQDRVDQDDLNKISRLLTEKLNGLPFYQLNDQLVAELVTALPAYQHIVTQLVGEISRLKAFNARNEKLLMKGVSNMIRLPEFRNVEMTQRVLSALEESKAMLAVLSEYLRTETPKVVIGDEHAIEGLKDCSMVVAPYGADAEPIGMLGVIGPKRMAYDKVVPMVQRISAQINEYLNAGHEPVRS